MEEIIAPASKSFALSPPPAVEDGDGGEAKDQEVDYGTIGSLLPRYYRLEPLTSSASLPNNTQETIRTVQWLDGFVAAPGYLKYNSSIGTSMCASSELAVRALELHSRQSPAGSPLRVLDLCCCPGMKLNSIADKLLAGDQVVGVDVSERRYSIY